MKALIASLFFVILAGSGFAQLSQIMGIDTTQSLGNFDYVYSTTTAPNSNIWMSGRCERTLTVSGGQVSLYGTLLQMTPSGAIITSQKSGFRSIHTLITSSDGNMVIGGEGSGFLCTSGMCKSDMLVAKVSSTYSVIWGRSFGNPNYNGTDGVKQVFESADSNIVVVGNMYESSLNSHPFITKLNGATGDTIWMRSMAYPSNQFGNAASEGPNGEIFLGVSGDLRIFKLDAAGTVIWSEGFASYGQVESVFAQPDGSVIAAGQYLTPVGDYSACLFKISASGNLEWFNDYNTPLPGHNEFLNTAIYDNGYFYLGGYHYSTPNYTGMYPLLFKTDITGSLVWSLELSSVPGEVKSIMPHGNKILCGLDYSPAIPNNRPDIMLTEIDMANAGNSCFVTHPLTMTLPTVSTTTYGTWVYTDYETQVTWIAFSNQDYWRTPTCITTAIQNIMQPAHVNISQHDNLITVQPDFNDKYCLEINDISGRRLYYQENISGNQSISTSAFTKQLLYVRIFTSQNTYVNKIFSGYR